ncbi:MAG TPA: hypothetical protein VK471_06005 [Solirubrobacterales bacterium]|nr:hypothetical protein [Solirubrobacterales bacterium]
MLRRVHINGNPRGRGARFLAGLADVVRWPFERAAWSVERGLLWPLRERFAGQTPSGRSASAAALVAIALAAVGAGVLLHPRDEAAPEQVAVATQAATPSAAPQPSVTHRQGPALHGVPPNFGVGKGVGVSKATEGDAGTVEPETPESATETSTDATPSEGAAGATTSSAKPVPAGPAAMKVARRFSEAFVFYEIGQRPARAKTVFGETATAELATALSERPPRLPADAKVPKARVVNLVPGPRAGKAYTVSVSLLRVGLTSELRLELSKKQGSWVITDVRG